MNNIKELLKEQIKFTDGYLDKYLAENGGKIDYIHGKRQSAEYYIQGNAIQCFCGR